MDWLADTLVIVGGINWGLIGLFNFNLVEALFAGTVLVPIIYTLVGLAAVYMVYSSAKAGQMSASAYDHRPHRTA